MTTREFHIPDVLPASKRLKVYINPDYSRTETMQHIRTFHFRVDTSSIMRSSVLSYPLMFDYFDYTNELNLLLSSLLPSNVINFCTTELPSMIFVASFSGVGYIQSSMNFVRVVESETIKSTFTGLKEMKTLTDEFVKSGNLRLLRPLLSLASTVYEENPEYINLMVETILRHFVSMELCCIASGEYLSILHGLSDFVRHIHTGQTQFMAVILEVLKLIFKIQYNTFDYNRVVINYSYYIGILERVANVIKEDMMLQRNLTNLVNFQLDKNPTAFDKKILNVYCLLIEQLQIITDTVSFSLDKAYPKRIDLKTEQFHVQALWLDSSKYELVELYLSKVELYVVISTEKEIFHPLTIDTNVHISAVMHDLYLPATFYGVPLNVPELHISILQKTYNPYPLKQMTSDIYNIYYDYEETDEVHGSLSQFWFKYVVTNKSHNETIISDSDCLIIQVPTSTVTDTLLLINSKSGYSLSVTKIKSLSHINLLELFEDVEEIVPQFSFPSVGNVYKDPNSILLPKLSLSESFTMRKYNWFLMIRLETGKQYTGPVPVPEDLKEQISIHCLSLACVKLNEIDQSWIAESCKATQFSCGFPRRLNCLCSSGNIFTGGVANCNYPLFVPWHFFGIVHFVLKNFQKSSLKVLFCLAGVWIIFLATLVWSRKLDKLQRTMGKTRALPGLFNPYEKHHYLLCVVTGWMAGSSLRGYPYITIVGSNNVSKKYHLYLAECYFKTGSEMWFLISSQQYLGNIEYVIVTLDPSPIFNHSWYVSRIYLRDLKTDQDWYCSFNSWVYSHEHDETFVIKPFFSFVSKVRKTFVMYSFIKYVILLHLFSGIFHNVPGSKFTKTQHTCSCFVSLLLLITLTTYFLGENHVENERYEELSIKIAAITSVASLLMNALFSVALPNRHYKQTLLWPMALKHSRNHLLEYMQRVVPHSYESCIDKHVRIVDNVLGDLARYLIACKTFESNVDNQCDILSPISLYKKTICNALSSEVLSQPSSLEMLQVHHRRRDSFRVSSLLMTADSIMDTVKRAHSFKRLSRIVSWFSLPINLLNSLLVVLTVFLTYTTCWTSLWLDSDTGSSFFYFLINSFLLMAFVFQPALILIFSFLLSDRWPPHKREAEDRAKGIRSSVQFRHKLLELDKLQTSDTCSSRHWTLSTDYISIIRAKCRTCAATKKAEHQHKKSYESNIHRVLAIILIMFIMIIIKNGNIDCRYKQTEFLKGILKIDELQNNTTITIDDVWDTLTTTFYYGLRNNLVNINTTSSLYTVSAMRVRQFRVIPNKNSIEIHNCINNISTIRNCLLNKSKEDYDYNNYAYTWNKITHRDIGHGPFTYETDNSAYLELKSGGYEAVYNLVPLKPYLLEDLRSRNWIDRFTRTLLVDMVVYNADLHLTTNIIQGFDFTKYGIYAQTRYHSTFQMFFSPAKKLLITACEMLFLAHACIDTFIKIRQVYYIGFKVLCESRQAVLSFLESILYWMAIAFSGWEKFTFKNIVTGIEQNDVDKHETRYVNFSSLYILNSINVLLSCFLILLNFIRLLNKIRNIRLLRIFLRLFPEIYLVATPTLLSIILLAVVGHLAFPETEEFSDMYKSMNSAMGLIFAKIHSDSSSLQNDTTGVYAMLWSFILNFILINHFVAVLNVMYNEAKLDIPEKRQTSSRKSVSS